MCHGQVTWVGMGNGCSSTRKNGNPHRMGNPDGLITILNIGNCLPSFWPWNTYRWINHKLAHWHVVEKTIDDRFKNCYPFLIFPAPLHLAFLGYVHFRNGYEWTIRQIYLFIYLYHLYHLYHIYHISYISYISCVYIYIYHIYHVYIYIIYISYISYIIYIIYIMYIYIYHIYHTSYNII